MIKRIWHSLTAVMKFYQTRPENVIKLAEGSLNNIYLNSLPFPKRQILDSSKFKEIADDNFKCDENCSKFCEWVENTVVKGEIAR